MPALELQINLAGNFASALEKANAGLEGTEKGSKKAAAELSLFEGEVGNLKTGLGGLELNFSALSKGGSFFTFDLAEGLRGAVELVHKLVEGFVDLGKEAVAVAGKTQDINLAVELNVGKDKAAQIGELAESFEKTTRFDASDIKQAMLPLLKQGIDDTSLLDDITTIGTDLAARTNGGIGAVQQTIDSFAGIFQKGRLKPAGLEAFGIQAQTYFAELGKELGVSTDAAGKLARAGKVSQDKLARLAINMVAAREGGEIGSQSLRGGETLGATLQRLSNVKEHLFEGLADSPGMKVVQGFLNNFIDTMKGPIGTELVAKVGGAFEAMFGDLSGPDGLEKVKSAVGAVAGKVGDFVDGFKQAWPSIQSGAGDVIDVIRVLPEILSEALTFGRDFAELWIGTQLITGLDAVVAKLGSAGVGGAIEGVRGGLNSALSPIAAATIAFEAWRFAFHEIGETIDKLGGSKAVLQDLKDFFTGSTGYHAVSQGNAGFAAMQAENAANVARAHAEASVGMSDGGMSVPAFASGGIVSGPTLALIGEDGPEAVVPLSKNRMELSDMAGSASVGNSRSGSSVSVGDIIVNLNGNATDDDAQHIAQAVRVELKRFLDELPA